MDIWGTRHDGNTERSGRPWTIKEFASDIHGDGLQPGSAEKNVGNWRDENEGPPRNRTTIQKIEAALFGQNPAFDEWKNDLRLARERSSARGRRLPDRPATNDFAAAALAVNPASLIMMESYIEQAERLRSERRANARQSAQLLAGEAARCNCAGNYDAGMRFALAGWLATTRERVECIPEIVEQLERGMRGLRITLNEAGACLHARIRDSAGNDIFLMSREGILYTHNVSTEERVSLAEFGKWFVLSEFDWCLISQGKDDQVSVVPLHLEDDESRVLELIWPICIGGINYRADRRPQDQQIRLSADGETILLSSSKGIVIFSIKQSRQTINYKEPDRLYDYIDALSADGRFVISNRSHERQAIWDSYSGKQICDLSMICNESTRLSWVSFTNDCSGVFIRFDSGFVYFLSMMDMSLCSKAELDHPITHSLDGSILAGCVNNQIYIFDTQNSEYIYRESESLFVNYGLKFSKDNALLYVQKPTTINALDVNDGFNLSFKTTPTNEVHSFGLSENGAVLLTNNISPDFEYQVYSVSAFDALTGNRLLSLSPSIAIATTSDASLIATNGDSKITIYDRSGTKLSSVLAKDWQCMLRFSSDSKLLYQLPGVIYTDVERVIGRDHCYVYDVEYERKSVRYLVELI